MYLHLDSQFQPFSSNQSIEFETFTFPGGEPHFCIKDDVSKVKEICITHRIKSFNDMGLLLLAVDALKREGVKKLSLFLPYLPAARQDRVMVKGEPLTVKVYTDLINAQDFESVTIFDPHSDVAPALLKNCKVVNNFSFVKNIIQDLPSTTVLISPDGGALKKVYKLAAYLQDFQVVECGKMRDLKTGKLSGFKVYSENLEGRDCLIIDDICDGGGTFLGVAKELKEKNAGKLYLAVSHGIFSKGFSELNKVFDKIYATNSFKTIQSSENFSQIEIKTILK